MHFNYEFILDRQHLEECYDQSQPFARNNRPRFKLIGGLIIAALILFFFVKGLNQASFFLIGLAVIEWISFRYRRSWWITRQVWSKNSGSNIKLTIDEKGINTKSLYINTQLLWKDVSRLDETEKGIMLTLNNGGSNYLSKNSISQDAIYFIKAQVSTSLADR